MVLDKIMTREINLPQDTGGNISQEARELIAVMAKEHKEREEAVKNSTRMCPTHHELSKYAGLTGSYQIAILVYECPKGHKFTYRPDQNY